MSRPRVFRAVPRDDGRWEVRADDEPRARATYATQALAWRQAKDLARFADAGMAVLHNRDGGTRTEHVYRRGGGLYPAPAATG
jgi:hypothetical protein